MNTPSRIAAVLVLSAFFLPACAKNNPSFPLSHRQSLADLDEMSGTPKSLSRPLVIVAGWGDPGFSDNYLSKRLQFAIEDERILTVNFKGFDTLDECRAHLIAETANAFGGDDSQTTEVDVVANSMGGLIAAYAADPAPGAPYLRVARLFAISSPFRGATMAGVPTSSEILIDMRPESEFLTDFYARNESLDYELIPYARVGDTWVGLENTAPPGEHPWWVPNAAFEPAHITAFTDPRIRADILRRLRGEPAYTNEPRSAPPGD